MDPIPTLAAVLALGVGAQWIAWRFHLPAILLLLLAGFVAGPVAGALAPRDLLGGLLEPLVEVSVALVLFEGGLSLDLRELRRLGPVVRNLISVGALVTWALGALAAIVILGLSTPVAILLGAILIVTGPTVIGPLLHHVRPSTRIGSILRWEGILIDPIGAILAVLTFEAMSGSAEIATATVVGGLARSTLAGFGVGLAAALVMVLVIGRYLLPDFLHNPVSMAVVVGAFAAANQLQEGSGLLAATVMGITLVSQRLVPVRHIAEFKENLRVLVISVLFIVLAATVSLDELRALAPRALLFAAVLIVVVRPLAVAVSSIGAGLSWQERLFIASVAPRGIVAAAVSSVFAHQLVDNGRADGASLAPITFVVIAATIAVYGLGAAPLARRLGIATSKPRGILIVGAHAWGRDLGRVLQSEGFEVTFADTDRRDIASARLGGFDTFYGSILSEQAHDELELASIGLVLAFTPNDELNALVCQRFQHAVGRAGCFQLPPKGDGGSARTEPIPLHQRGRLLFGGLDAYEIEERYRAGARFKSTPLSATFSLDDLAERHRSVVPVFLVTPAGDLLPFSDDDLPDARPGHRIISLAREHD